MPSVPPTWAEGPCLYCPQGLCQQPSDLRGEHLMDKCMTCLRPPSVELVTFSVTFGFQLTQSHYGGASLIPLLSVSGSLPAPLCGPCSEVGPS